MLMFNPHESAPKAYLTGTHRGRTPAETLHAFTPLMQRCGVTRLANLTGLDYIGIPVYAAYRPLGRSLAVSQGKGIDGPSAKVSALVEALERWHAEHIDLPLRYDTMRRMEGIARVLNPLAVTPAESHVFDPDRPALWIEGWDLFEECPIWVPFDLVNLNMVEPAGTPPRLFRKSANGLAAGNSRLEATVHALCELVERDATALWFLDPRSGSDKRTQVDLATVIDPVNRGLISRILDAGLCLGLYDTTADTGIPAYQTVIFEQPGTYRAMGYFWGFGCHLDSAIAASRALTEAAQCRLAEISGSREDIAPGDYRLNRGDDELREMQQMVATPPASQRFGDRLSRATGTFGGDFDVVRSELVRIGITAGAVVDLTKPEIGLPVVKVIVPELEGYFHGSEFRPGLRGRRQLALADPATTA